MFFNTTKESLVLSRHWLGVLQIKFWYYLTGDGVITHRLRAQSHKTDSTSQANHKSRLLPVPLTNQLQIGSSPFLQTSVTSQGCYLEVAQSCLTLCDPMDCSQPGSSVHGIFQARVLEWVAISFSRVSFWLRDRTWVSRIVDRRIIIWATREALQLLINWL